MQRQRPTRLVMGSCIVEIDRIVLREVQYLLEVNRCRNEEIIVKGNFGWVSPMWAGPPRIDRIVIREVQYQFEVNLCRNEEIISMWAGRPRIERIVIRDVQYHFEVNWSPIAFDPGFRGSMARTDGQTDRQTDGQMAEITTISPRFSKNIHKTNVLTKFHDDWTKKR
ncbi:hypothetical protein DPMN_105467 [Dreissena polymorpha]|uniref:Uncharacterized protein n=1 Tax=Dreissena polymorpha TaxID=45954 RepID=A0A9D4K2B4_DREPO|nr:hypothetical protein DPMN_105467 [Dreissena polymorpha]